ncbi:xanthine dehydrogenase family protein molybdopterin-binding subunit, partial [Chloroflexota bacterium]
REKEENALGMVTNSIGARECLDKVAEWIDWGKPSSDEGYPWRRGKGIAVGNKNTQGATASVVHVKVHPDATIELRHSAQEIGQGCDTVLAQIAAEEFSTTIDKVRMITRDTAITPYDFGAVSSRTTIHDGNALRLACQNAKQQIFEIASEMMDVPPEDLTIKDGVVYVASTIEKSIRISDLFTPTGIQLKRGEIVGIGTYVGPYVLEDAETAQSTRPVICFTHGANAAEVMVNVETGETKVLKIAGAFDMGQPINPKLCECQIEGGIANGIGSTLHEEMIIDNGVVVNPSFVEYKLPTTMEVPSGTDMGTIIEPVPYQEGPYGAKGLGEATMVAVAPAIANAVFNAIGVRIKDLPITREKVLKEKQSLGLKD